MRILLISGGLHHILKNYIPKKSTIVNETSLTLRDVQAFLQHSDPKVEAVLITDEALTMMDGQDKDDLNSFLAYLSKRYASDIPVVFVTRDFMKDDELAGIKSQYNNFKITKCDFVRVTVYQFTQLFDTISEHRKPTESPKEKPETEKKKSFLDRFKPKPKTEPEVKATDALSKDLEKISRGISRIVAVTGHRGSGLTSTAVNVACEAGKRGLSAIIIDMDIEYRSTNMYFSSFHERTKRDEDINASLIRTLARPQDYMTTAFNLKDDVWMTALGYGFYDRRLVDQFYNNSKLVGLLSVLRSRFNLIILDMPLDLFRTFKETLIHIDVFALCVPNNLHSVLSTLRNVEVVLDRENASYLNAKSKVVVTKYNDRSRFQGDIFTPDRVCEVLSSGLSDSFTYEVRSAGHVPYSSEFDTQIETDVLLINSSTEHERAYGNILLRLMEGAK